MKHDFFKSDYILDTVDLQHTAEGWTSTSRDPYFTIKPDTEIEQGWYRITLKIKTGAMAMPRVYFDLGAGFNEMQSVLLRSASQDVYTAVVRFEHSPYFLRLDPLDCKGVFEIETFTFARYNKVKFTAFAASKALKMLARNPIGNFKRVIATGKSLLQNQNFRSINPVDRNVRDRTPYDVWMSNYDYVPSLHGDAKRAEIKHLELQPKISILMPVYNTPAALLNAAIQSVVDQIYPNWELCICNDASTAAHVRLILKEWTQKDSRIKVIHRKHNGHISKASNSALTLVTSEWVALLDHDDTLRNHALAEIVIAINDNPDCQLIYSDEDKIDEDGVRTDPYFKCDFSPELFRSMNYLNHITVHRTDNIIKVGGWRHAYVGSQDYDLNLRIWERISDKQVVHIPKVLYNWRAVEGSTALAGHEKNYTIDAGIRALNDHLKRTSADASASVIPEVNHYRVKYNIPDPAPLVSLIIPTKDRMDLVKACIDSIYEKTIYPNFEIILVNNNSNEKESFDYFAELEKSGKATVLTYNVPFNYSAINNYAVSKSKGQIIGLINNDIEIISEGWLTEMVSWAAQEHIGCVGAKLYFENGQIQHAGVILGLGGVAGHSHKYFPKASPGYYYRTQVTQNLSAVTAACLLVKKSVFEEVNGLNEKDLIIAFNDVDFCLKVRAAGYLNVWTPFAEMYHYESISRGKEDNPEKVARFNREIHYMQTTWDSVLKGDPYYSPNLSDAHEDFSIRH